METVYLVCLQHDRHWPCKKLGSKEREHFWACWTTWTDYRERVEAE